MPESKQSEIVKAPWTADQVASLNGYQESGYMHPFTCGGCDDRDGLYAREDGWHCSTCQYTQDWAHDFMANWGWLLAKLCWPSRSSNGRMRRLWAWLKQDETLYGDPEAPEPQGVIKP